MHPFQNQLICFANITVAFDKEFKNFRRLGSLRMENVDKQYEQLAHVVVAGAAEDCE